MSLLGWSRSVDRPAEGRCSWANSEALGSCWLCLVSRGSVGALSEISTDPEKLEQTYEEWVENAKRTPQAIWEAGTRKVSGGVNRAAPSEGGGCDELCRVVWK